MIHVRMVALSIIVVFMHAHGSHIQLDDRVVILVGFRGKG